MHFSSYNISCCGPPMNPKTFQRKLSNLFERSKIEDSYYCYLSRKDPLENLIKNNLLLIGKNKDGGL